MAVPKIFFAAPLDWLYPLAVGQSWPEGDEDLARQAAQAWTDALRSIVKLADSGNAVADGVNYSVQGASGDVFNRYWDKYVGGDNSYLGQQAKQAQQLAASLLDFAQQLEYTKWAINTQLAILAVQVAYDLLAAPFTQGLSMAEAFLAVFMARSVIRMIVARLLESVLFIGLPDLVAQTIQLANAWSHGKDGSFDGKRLLTDLEMGVVAGSLGALLQPLMLWKPMTGVLRDAFGVRTAALLPAMAQGALTNVGTNAAMFYLPTPDGRHASSPFDHWFLAALSGAFAGGVFHGLNQMHGAERPSATFRGADGDVLFHGSQHPDDSYFLITPDGRLAGRGAFLPDGTLVVGDRRLTVGQATISNADGVAHLVYQSGEPARHWGFDQVLPVDTSVAGVHGTIELPAGSTATFGPDQRIAQLAVHDEHGTTFYTATPDHNAFELHWPSRDHGLGQSALPGRIRRRDPGQRPPHRPGPAAGLPSRHGRGDTADRRTSRRRGRATSAIQRCRGTAHQRHRERPLGRCISARVIGRGRRGRPRADPRSRRGPRHGRAPG